MPIEMTFQNFWERCAADVYSMCVCDMQWQIPLKTLHCQNPPNRETRIPRYKFKSNWNLNLNLDREILKNLSFSIWSISGM